MKPAPFTYLRPESLDEALQLLSQHGDDAKPVAGGQSLLPMMNFRLVHLDFLIDIGRLPGLGETATADGGMTLGALVRHRDLASSPVPLLAECAPLIGHPAIRNRGTLGGSIVHADPAAELPAALVALEATITATSLQGEREIPAADFFQGIFTTALRPDELAVSVRIPAPAPRTGWAVRELMRRHGDFAVAGAMAGIALDGEGRCADSRLVLFGVAETPWRAWNGEASLRGQTLSPARLAEAAYEAAEPLTPPEDIHASRAYRKHAARVYAERALMDAWQRAQEDT